MLTIGDRLDDGVEIIANTIELSFEEDVSDRIDGICYIGNVEAEKYLQINNVNNQNKEYEITEIHPLGIENESQLWKIVYLHNGYYCILSEKNNMALGVYAHEVTKRDSRVRQFTCESTSLAGTNLQWKIEPVRVLNGTQQYKITNRATLEAGYSYVMCANGTLSGSDGVIDLYISDNDSYLDEWKILNIREIFGVQSIGISDIYEIQYKNSRIYSGINDEGTHLGDITCESYDNITFSGGLWRFQRVSGGAYRIFSMEKCVLGEMQYALGILDGDVVLLMDDEVYYQNTLWYVGEIPGSDNALCIYSAVDNTKFLSVIDGNVDVGMYNAKYSQFYLEKYEFPNLWDGWYNGLVKTEKNGKTIYQIPYIIADSATEAYRTNIEEAIALWHFDLIGIEFIETTNPNDALITFEYKTDYGLNLEVATVIGECLLYDDESVMNEEWDNSKIVFMERFPDTEDKTLAIAHEIGHTLKLGHEMTLVVETIMWSEQSTEEHEGCAYSELTAPTYYDLFAVKQKLESIE